MVKRLIALTGVSCIFWSTAYGATLRAGMYDYLGGAAIYANLDGQHFICDSCSSTAPLEAAPPVILVASAKKATPTLIVEPESVKTLASKKEENQPAKNPPEAPFIITVHFSFDSSRLSKTEKVKLDKITADKADGVLLKISGHTCKTGDKEYNRKLSVRRAKSVEKYLSAKGISVKEIQGYGASKVQGGAKTADRRAEIAIGGSDAK